VAVLLTCIYLRIDETIFILGGIDHGGRSLRIQGIALNKKNDRLMTAMAHETGGKARKDTSSFKVKPSRDFPYSG